MADLAHRGKQLSVTVLVLLWFAAVPLPASAAAAPRPDSAACERWRILTERQTARTAKIVDRNADELAFHHCMTGSTADDEVELRDLDGDYSPRTDSPCERSEGYLSAMTSPAGGGPAFAPAGSSDERVEADCIADKTELVRYFYARPDSCYDAVNDPDLYAGKCRWQSGLQIEKFEHSPFIGWWLTIIFVIVVVLGAAAGASGSRRSGPGPMGKGCLICGASHSTAYHQGRGG
ncbi:hypothetical protein [Actinoplanes sp. GCM10030250]|uniref:hypothetical protein n=1 Tax=Actinoplanes sp. GCM10030250 TaxID=3273376 RepID=UPI00360EDBAA